MTDRKRKIPESVSSLIGAKERTMRRSFGPIKGKEEQRNTMGMDNGQSTPPRFETLSVGSGNERKQQRCVLNHNVELI